MEDYRPAAPRDHEAIVALLAAAGLPASDLAPEKLKHYLVCAPSGDGQLAACVGLEVYGDVGLLRSFVVSPARQACGLGSRGLERMHEHARSHGIRRLYLLTTTASDYFARHGYQRIERGAVPAGIQRSTEFTSLCPASAVAMTINLDHC